MLFKLMIIDRLDWLRHWLCLNCHDAINTWSHAGACWEVMQQRHPRPCEHRKGHKWFMLFHCNPSFLSFFLSFLLSFKKLFARWLWLTSPSVRNLLPIACGQGWRRVERPAGGSRDQRTATPAGSAHLSKAHWRFSAARNILRLGRGIFSTKYWLQSLNFFYLDLLSHFKLSIWNTKIAKKMWRFVWVRFSFHPLYVQT